MQKHLSVKGEPTCEAAAITGQGVFDTLKEVAKLAWPSSRKTSEHFQVKSSSSFPVTEVAIHLLSLTGGLFKKANKWLRSPSFKVGQPRPNSSAFEYMRGP